MNTLSYLITALFCVGSFSLSAATAKEKIKEHIGKAKESIPGVGLISNKIDYDGLTIRNFSFDTEEKLTFVTPGQKIVATMEYEIDADKLENFQMHHFIYGLYPTDFSESRGEPLGCLVHSRGGFINSSGSTKIKFNAPQASGVYQLRICHASHGLTESKAQEEWYKHGNPPSNTIIGIVVVE